MPNPKLHRCVSDVKGQGKPEDSAYAICNASIDKTKEADYPWGQCEADQKKAGHDKESADKICGSIKAKYGETIQQSMMRQVLETKLKGCQCKKTTS